MAKCYQVVKYIHHTHMYHFFSRSRLLGTNTSVLPASLSFMLQYVQLLSPAFQPFFFWVHQKVTDDAALRMSSSTFTSPRATYPCLTYMYTCSSRYSSRVTAEPWQETVRTLQLEKGMHANPKHEQQHCTLQHCVFWVLDIIVAHIQSLQPGHKSSQRSGCKCTATHQPGFFVRCVQRCA